MTDLKRYLLCNDWDYAEMRKEEPRDVGVDPKNPRYVLADEAQKVIDDLKAQVQALQESIDESNEWDLDRNGG